MRELCLSKKIVKDAWYYGGREANCMILWHIREERVLEKAWKMSNLKKGEFFMFSYVGGSDAGMEKKILVAEGWKMGSLEALVCSRSRYESKRSWYTGADGNH